MPAKISNLLHDATHIRYGTDSSATGARIGFPYKRYSFVLQNTACVVFGISDTLRSWEFFSVRM